MSAPPYTGGDEKYPPYPQPGPGGYPPYPPVGGNQPPQIGFAPPPNPYDAAPTAYPPAYPPPGGAAYPPPGGAGYPPPGGAGYPPLGGGGYPPPNQAAGYPPGPGYAPPQQYGGGYAPAPIVSQPTGFGEEWMQVPHTVTIPNCPPGLEYLTTLDQLFVKQKVELLEAFIGFETNNKFTVKNAQGQKIFWAVEDNDCCTRNCCGPMRPFDMKILDAAKNEIIHLYRPLRCETCWCPCFLQEMDVCSPPGNKVGSIAQEWSILGPQFSIKNQNDETVMRIEGPCCRFSFCGNDVEFKLLTLDGRQVGKISKQWSGFARELFTDSDFFGISFPMDLDVRMKAVMLGACFLIDAMFFEKAGNQESDGPGMF